VRDAPRPVAKAIFFKCQGCLTPPGSGPHSPPSVLFGYKPFLRQPTHTHTPPPPVKYHFQFFPAPQTFLSKNFPAADVSPHYRLFPDRHGDAFSPFFFFCISLLCFWFDLAPPLYPALRLPALCSRPVGLFFTPASALTFPIFHTPSLVRSFLISSTLRNRYGTLDQQKKEEA